VTDEKEDISLWYLSIQSYGGHVAGAHHWMGQLHHSHPGVKDIIDVKMEWTEDDYAAYRERQKLALRTDAPYPRGPTGFPSRDALLDRAIGFWLGLSYLRNTRSRLYRGHRIYATEDYILADIFPDGTSKVYPENRGGVPTIDILHPRKKKEEL
jgi:hypothetical protein